MMKNAIRETVNGFTRILQMSPPFDRRNSDPSKNYGIHGMDVRFVLIKDQRAVQFLAYTGIYLPHVSDELAAKANGYNHFRGMGADVGYHSPRPMYEDQRTMGPCEYIGCECYYDGSSLRAQEWYDVWLREGNDRIWAMLEEEWAERFAAPSPAPDTGA